MTNISTLSIPSKTMMPTATPVSTTPNGLLVVAALILFTFSNLAPTFGWQDAVYRYRAGGGNSKISGKVTGMTPLGVTVESSSGAKEIAASAINKIDFDSAPVEISRARDRIEGKRFVDALAELEKITNPINAPLVQQEIDYLKAYSTAEISLDSGAVTAQEAGKLMSAFVEKNKQSIHFYPASEILGKLLFAVGRTDLAEKQFAELTNSQWTELVLRGHFYRGEMLNQLEKYDEALAAYKAILAMPANDDATQQYKLLAKCQIAKTNALAGKPPAESIAAINEIIKNENPANAELFAYAYNALGTCQLKADNLKEAATAFLHTELLFAQESEPQAEALYQLALIWPKLDQTDRASRAREGLKSRYRNSYWASKL